MGRHQGEFKDNADEQTPHPAKAIGLKLSPPRVCCMTRLISSVPATQ